MKNGDLDYSSDFFCYVQRFVMNCSLKSSLASSYGNIFDFLKKFHVLRHLYLNVSSIETNFLIMLLETLNLETL